MYNSLWFKAHWVAGVFLGLFLIIIGFSGAVLSYQKEILRLINPASHTVVANGEMMSPTQIVDSYIAKNSDAKINSIMLYSDATSSAVINVAVEGERRGKSIYINPYSGEVLPDVVGRDFFMFFFKLHRWLALEGEMTAIGKQISAIATIAIIFLAISGIVINWARIRRGFLDSLKFSFKSKNRVFLSTMHSALGMWAAPALLIISLSGLYWSYDWYRDAMYSVVGVEKPQRFNKPAPQTAEKSEKSKDGMRGERGESTRGGERSGMRPMRDEAPQSYEMADRLYETFKTNVSGGFKEVSLSLKSHDNHYDVRYLAADAPHFRATNSIEVDATSFEILTHKKYSDKALNERIMSSMLPIHSGEYWGWIGQALFFISSLLVVLFTITGYMLYFDRAKKKKAKAKS